MTAPITPDLFDAELNARIRTPQTSPHVQETLDRLSVQGQVDVARIMTANAANNLITQTPEGRATLADNHQGFISQLGGTIRAAIAPLAGKEALSINFARVAQQAQSKGNVRGG